MKKQSIRSGSDRDHDLVAAAMTEQRVALLVLGMHRSGTSALGGVLVKLGATSPRTLLPPRQANPRGFWESAKLMKLHDRVLSAAGSAWHDWGKIDLEGLRPIELSGFRKDLTDVLEHEFGHAGLMMVKDPRLCRLVPFWLDALSATNIELRAVLPMRHPFEVAASLMKRSKLGYAHCILLWLRYVLEAERNSRGLRRVFVSYDALLEDWRSVAMKVSTQLDIPLALTDANAVADVHEFLSGSLRNNQKDCVTGPQSGLTQLAVHVLQLLERVDDDGRNLSIASQLDEISVQLDVAHDAHAELTHDTVPAEAPRH
jgi:hypothetical protein